MSTFITTDNLTYICSRKWQFGDKITPYGKIYRILLLKFNTGKEKEEYLYRTFLAKVVHSKCSGMDHTVLPGNAGRKKVPKKSPSGHHRTILSGYIFASKARIDNRKKIVKQQYVLHMSPQYGELRSTNG